MAVREFLQRQKMTCPLFRLCSAFSLPQVLNKCMRSGQTKNVRKALINKVKNFSFLIKSLISSLVASPEGPVIIICSADMVDRCSCSARMKGHLSYRSRMTTSSIRTTRTFTTKIQRSCDEQGSTDIIMAQPLRKVNLYIAMVS